MRRVQWIESVPLAPVRALGLAPRGTLGQSAPSEAAGYGFLILLGLTFWGLAGYGLYRLARG